MTSPDTDTPAVVLKPCPFCGAEPYVRQGVNGYLHCKSVGCYAYRAQIVPLDDPKQVAAWNRRASPLPTVGEEPCPFCGSPDVEVRSVNDETWRGGFRIACNSCGSRTGVSVSQPDVVAAWNRRASPLPTVREAEPVAWRWRQLMHDSMGGWERKIESYRPGDWVKPEDIQDLEPLYAASPAPDVEGMRERVALIIRQSGIDRGWANKGDAERLANTILLAIAKANAQNNVNHEGEGT